MRARAFTAIIAAIAGVLSILAFASGAFAQPQGPNGDQDGDGITDLTECSGARSGLLRNGSFETPDIASGSFRTITPDPSFYWNTTASDGKVELWDNHADGGSVPTPLAAADGDQIAEFNANVPGALYQDVPTIPGEQYLWSLSHRGRGGTDTMALKIGPPTAVVEQQQIADGNQAWGEHFGAYPVPAGQIITRFQFEAVATQSGSLSIGNFLDAIDFTPCPDTDGDGTADFEDTDSDNDTIPDATEGTSDTDGDGVPNWRDPFERSADVAVTKTGPATARPGDVVRYTVTATNNGPDNAVGVVFEDDLPPGVIFDEPASWPCSYEPQTGLIVCTLEGLPVGETDSAEIVVRVAPDTPAGTSLSNTLRVASFSTDPVPGNDVATAALTVTAALPPAPPAPSVPTETAAPSAPAELPRTGGNTSAPFVVTALMMVALGATCLALSRRSGRTQQQERGAGSVS